MRAYGRVNLIGVAIVAAIVGGLYYGITVMPVYLDNLDIREVVAGCYNESGRINDEMIKARIKGTASRIGKHMAEDGFGTLVEAPGLGLTDDQITVARDEVRKTILIRVEYDQEVVFWPGKKKKRIHMVTAKDGTVPPA